MQNHITGCHHIGYEHCLYRRYSHVCNEKCQEIQFYKTIAGANINYYLIDVYMESFSSFPSLQLEDTRRLVGPHLLAKEEFIGDIG